MTVIEPMGVVEKAQAIEMAADKPWEHVEFSDVKIREIDPDCIVLAYHGQASHPGDPEPYRGSIASTYRRVGGKWLLVMSAHQPWARKDAPKA